MGSGGRATLTGLGGHKGVGTRIRGTVRSVQHDPCTMTLLSGRGGRPAVVARDIGIAYATDR